MIMQYSLWGHDLLYMERRESPNSAPKKRISIPLSPRLLGPLSRDERYPKSPTFRLPRIDHKVRNTPIESTFDDLPSLQRAVNQMEPKDQPQQWSKDLLVTIDEVNLVNLGTMSARENPAPIRIGISIRPI
jgi:hypothetical protein